MGVFIVIADLLGAFQRFFLIHTEYLKNFQNLGYLKKFLKYGKKKSMLPN